MLELDDEERLDQAIDRLGAILRRLEGRQTRIEHRLTTLYQIAFVAFVVIVASISFLVVVLSSQAPGITVAIDQMNTRFASVAENMARMDHTVAAMRGHVDSLPAIIHNVDRIDHQVGAMSGNVAAMGDALVAIDRDIARLTVGVGDMRASFEIMETRIGSMSNDVNHMSQPMRMFNFMNPFR